MSARFWLFSLASAGAALTSGLALGLYATTPPRVTFADFEPSYSTSSEPIVAADGTDLAGPEEIDCKGCGPTLAQRQMTAMMGSWSGYDDPAVQRYEAQHVQTDTDWQPQDDAPPSPVHRLPANIERFADGDDAPPQPTQLAQSSQSTYDQQPVATVTSY
ncbi:MAG TPA: hypothetical protein VN110_01670 [Sphingobium sp.]|nr:hypothetical protein [Sphingobium sp.]